jgi:hypothetical protein
MISEPILRLVQTVHLSCIDANNVSKYTEMRFHMAHVTMEFHRVPPKLFLSLWYVSANRASILRQDEHYHQMDQNELPVEPRQLGYLRVRPKRFLSLWYIWHKPCTYLSSKLN